MSEAITQSRDFWRRRTGVMQQIRHFMHERDILEVDTPILSQAGATDPHLNSFVTQLQPGGQTYYLQTSPEFAMKRLLADASGAIYQIAKVFRNAESGQRHNPEFTLLEWYRPGLPYLQLMNEVAELLAVLRPRLTTTYLTYQACFEEYCQLNPHQATLADLKYCIENQRIEIDPNAYTEKDDCLQLLMSHVIEPQFPRDQLTFVYDFPASQAMLAQLNEQGLAERFEAYYWGLELANGFQELRDSAIQMQRFQQDLAYRRTHALPTMPIDLNLINVLDNLPFCSGVALGIERLMMCICQTSNLSEVISFPMASA